MTNKIEIAQDLIQFFEQPDFEKLKPVLEKYEIYKLDPIAIQTLIHKLSFELCKKVLEETKKGE